MNNINNMFDQIAKEVILYTVAHNQPDKIIGTFKDISTKINTKSGVLLDGECYITFQLKDGNLTLQNLKDKVFYITFDLQKNDTRCVLRLCKLIDDQCNNEVLAGNADNMGSIPQSIQTFKDNIDKINKALELGIVKLDQSFEDFKTLISKQK
jgi:hypothetical protein